MAEYLVNLNNGKTDEKAAFRLIGKLLNQSGVLESTGLTVSATTPTPDMTVKVAGSVASDNAVFITSTGDTYHGWNTAQYSVTILSNATGATKYDAIVAYADTAAGSTTANNPGGLKFIAVRSSGAGVASAADIAASAVGTKPYLRLADVTVANGVSSINSGNIVDTRVFSAVNQVVSTLGYAQITTNFANGSTVAALVTGLTANVTIPPGARRVKITACASSMFNSGGAASSVINIWDGPVGTGTIIGGASANPGANIEVPAVVVAVQTPAAGAKTYNVSLRTSAASTTATLTASSTTPAFLLVEAI